jgi:CRISP-associated protein Cas1
MHQGRRGAPALVFDLMEPNRPRTDAAVLRFALSETFTGADFLLRSDGVVRLAPQLARRVCQLVGSSDKSRARGNLARRNVTAFRMGN